MIARLIALACNYINARNVNKYDKDFQLRRFYRMRKRNFFDDYAEVNKPEPSPTTAAPAPDPTPAAEVVEAPEPEQIPAPVPQVETSAPAAESEVKADVTETE